VGFAFASPAFPLVRRNIKLTFDLQNGDLTAFLRYLLASDNNYI
jgi:hypothetical protein